MYPAAVLEAGQAEVGGGQEVEDGLAVAAVGVALEALEEEALVVEAQAAVGKKDTEKYKSHSIMSGFYFTDFRRFLPGLKSFFISLG